MKKIILGILFSIGLLNAWGTIDKTVTWVELPERDNKFDIEEEDMDDTIKNALDKYLKENDLVAQFKESIQEALTSHVNISKCGETTTKVVAQDYSLKEDITLPSGKVLAKKGTLPNIPFQDFDMCFVGNETDENMDLLMQTFPKNCIFIANEKNVIELKKKYGVEFFPLTFFIKDKLDLECLPAKVSAEQKQDIHYYINTEDLKK